MTPSAPGPPFASPVWWPGAWCAVLLLASEWALSLIEAYVSLTGTSASPAWVIPTWMFLTPIGLAAAFILGCGVACLAGQASALRRRRKKPESAA